MKPPVTMAFKLCSFPGWNRWFFSMCIDILNELFAVISFGGQHLTFLYVYLTQQWKAKVISFLFFTNYQANRIPVRIHYGIYFVPAPPGCDRSRLEAPFCTSAVLMHLVNEPSKESSSSSVSGLEMRMILSRYHLDPLVVTAVNSFLRAIAFQKIPPRWLSMGNTDDNIKDYTVIFRGRPFLPRFSGGSKSAMRFHSAFANPYRFNIMNPPFFINLL